MPLLQMILNGKETTVEIEPDDLLVDVLRDKLCLLYTSPSPRD